MKELLHIYTYKGNFSTSSYHYLFILPLTVSYMINLVLTSRVQLYSSRLATSKPLPAELHIKMKLKSLYLRY